MRDCGISARLTFSNSLLREEHLRDRKCNALCDLLEDVINFSSDGGLWKSHDYFLEELKKIREGAE